MKKYWVLSKNHMLREIKKIRQINGEPSRRWFNSHDMDLIIWHDKNEFIGFQICYEKTGQEKALSWKKDSGQVHQKVDDGESRKGHYKATPLLVNIGQYNIEKIKNDFEKYSQSISKEVRCFVQTILAVNDPN